MRLSFDSIDEVKEFVKQLKGGRRTKADDDGDATEQAPATGAAPAPIQPPPAGAPSFTPPSGPAPTFQPGAAPAPSAPPANTMPAIVGRIVTQVDKLIAGQVPGQPTQPADAVLQWLRGQIAPFDASAANATLDQVKQVYLNKLPEQALNQIAQLIGA
jgi:hypothetical protein